MPDQECQSAGYLILLLFLCRKIAALRCWIVLNSDAVLSEIQWSEPKSPNSVISLSSVNDMRFCPALAGRQVLWFALTHGSPPWAGLWVWRVRNDQIISRTLCTNKTVFVWSNSATTHVVWFFFSLQRYHQFIAFFPPFLWKLHNYLEPVKMIKLFSTNPHTIPLY